MNPLRTRNVSAWCLVLVVVLLITTFPAATPTPAATRYGALHALPARQAVPPTVDAFPAACGSQGIAAQQVFLPLLSTTGSAQTVAAAIADSAATPVTPGATTPFAAATAFLYRGADAAQQGVAPAALDPARAAVVRGKLITRAGDPLPDVTVAVLDHPEYGTTSTGNDGLFNLAVNGGAQLTLCFLKDGYIPAHRPVALPTNDYAWLQEEVALIPLDERVTTVDLNAAALIQAVQGSVVSDDDGTRQAALFFSQGTVVELVMPDGSIETISTANVRATEYTVGERGPEAMPGELPPMSGYTYAVEFTIDEALTAGAMEVRFSQPVINYLENFLDFPVGTDVPTGSYDRTVGQWIPEANGRVLEVLRIEDGLAVLDVDGNGQAASAAALAELGISEAEQAQLAALYTAGQSLWRVPITHFTPWDHNWPFGPPDDAESGGECQGGECGPDPEPKPCEEDGSIIECENQVLGERIPIVGTPYSLNYRSSRVPGHIESRTLNIQVSGDDVPSSLARIEVEIEVAGQRHTRTFPAEPNQQYQFTWDGLDAFGQPVQQTQRAKTRIGYVYPGDYRTAGSSPRSFSQAGTASITGNLTREEVTFWRTFTSTLYPWDARTIGLGGWTLDAHHSFHPLGTAALYQGDGGFRTGYGNDTLVTLAGNGVDQGSPENDGMPAAEVPIATPRNIEYGPDGLLYLSTADCRIWRITEAATLDLVAGSNLCFPSQEGVPADETTISDVHGLAFAPDGSLHFVDLSRNTQNQRATVRRITPQGTIEIVAGTYVGSGSSTAEGIPATEAELLTPDAIAFGPDGSLYISETSGYRVRRVSPDGLINTVAGGDITSPVGDGGPAIDANIGVPSAIAVDSEGALYIAGRPSSDYTIRKVGTDGIIQTIAGGSPTNALPGLPEGVPANQVRVGLVGDMAFGPDGSLYYSDSSINTIYRIDPAGILTRASGSRSYGFSPDGTPALDAQLARPEGLALRPDGALYASDAQNFRVRQVFGGGTLGLQRITNGVPELLVPAEDGSEVYVFNENGQHQRTLHAMTGATRTSFAYDGAGRLVSITDGDGNTTTIERDGAGNPTAIVGPDGQRTTLSVNSDGYLTSITNPANESYTFTYADAGGLLTSFQDRRGNTSTFSYDSLGRLTRNDMPGPAAWNISRIDSAQGYTVTLESAENRATAYRVETLPDGSLRRTRTFPDGVEATKTRYSGVSLQHSYGNGAIVDFALGSDPRWNMQAPVAENQTLTTPDGLMQVGTEETIADLDDNADLLSLRTLTDTLTINGQTATRVYDAATRTYTITTPVGLSVRLTTDEQGRITSEHLPGLNPSSFAYDSRGRIISVTEGSGSEERTTSISYDDAGEVASITDAFNRISSFSYDAAGRATQDVLPGGRSIGYTYDAEGNLTGITPPDQPAHSFTYDERGQTTSYTPPAVDASDPTTSYTYDADGQLTQVAYPGGATLDYSYDAAGRLDTLTMARGTVSYQYDTTSGQLTTISAPDMVELARSYDGPLLIGETWSGPVSGSVSDTLDDDMRTIQRRVNGANAIVYSYNADGSLSTAGSLSIAYNAQSGLLGTTTLDNTSDTWTFNGFAEVTGREVQANGTPLYTTSYAYDQLGRITQRIETIASVSTTYDYSYDAAGRLATVQANGSTIEQYSYDANGNRTSATVDGASANGSYDAQDRLTQYGSTSYTYTPDGALLSATTDGQTTTYTYDVQGNLLGVTLPDSTSISYLVDGSNRRVGKRVNGTLVQGFLYGDSLNPVAELDGSNAVVSRFVYASRTNVPDYMLRGGTTYRIISDQRGSVRLVAHATTGDIVQRIDYDAFGRVTQDTNPGFQPFGFAGGLYDPDTGLVRFGARDYDARTGRWTSKDPLLFAGGDTNLYAYVQNDPVNWLDPTGTQSGEVPPDLARQLQQAAKQAGQQNNTNTRIEQMPQESTADFIKRRLRQLRERRFNSNAAERARDLARYLLRRCTIIFIDFNMCPEGPRLGPCDNLADPI